MFTCTKCQNNHGKCRKRKDATYFMIHKIEFAKPEDATELLEIYAPFVENTTVTFEYAVPTVEEFTKRIESITAKFPYLVYKLDDKIVGYAYAAPFRTRAACQWSVESSIYVNPSYHGHGIAPKLYSVLIDLLKEQGFYNLYSYISIPNHKSVMFHKKYGFEEIGTYENSGYKLGKWCTLLAMCKRLKKPSTPTEIKPIGTIESSRINDIIHFHL